MNVAKLQTPIHTDITADRPRFRKRYSCLVVSLKIMLPMIILLLIGGMNLWIRQHEVTVPIDQTFLPHHEVVNGRFFGVTQSGQPLTIFFKTATQSVTDSTIIDIVEPHAEFIQRNGHWVTIKATRGQYHQDTAQLVLYDDIQVIRADSTELHTDHAAIDTRAGSILGTRPVQGQTTHNEIDAQGFYISDFGDKIIFFHTSMISVTKR